MRLIYLLYFYMATLSKSKTNTNTKIMVAAGIAVIGGAAFVAMGNLGQRGYSNYNVECYDGSSARIQNGQYTLAIVGQPEYREAIPTLCRTAADWKSSAQSFCTVRSSNVTGKTGVNSFSVSSRCRVPKNYGYGYSFGYGYGYTYGYNAPSLDSKVNTKSDYKKTGTKTLQKKSPQKKSSFWSGWGKK